MSQPDTPALAGMSIGAVLDLLRPDFPDVTISKIRFLEAEGLVTPERTPSGYWRFTAYDCARLRFIPGWELDGTGVTGTTTRPRLPAAPVMSIFILAPPVLEYVPGPPQ